MEIKVGERYQLRNGEVIYIIKELFSISHNKSFFIYYGITAGDFESKWDEYGKWIPDKQNTEMEIISEIGVYSTFEEQENET